MSIGLIEKIGWELDDLQKYIKEIEHEGNRNDADFVISTIRDYLDEMESELDDINECVKRIV